MTLRPPSYTLFPYTTLFRSLTTDHPNGGGFWRYPEIMRLLMDVEFRKSEVRKLPPEALNRIELADIDREYTISEMVIVTSAGDRKSTRLNSSHSQISYAVFC